MAPTDHSRLITDSFLCQMLESSTAAREAALSFLNTTAQAPPASTLPSDGEVTSPVESDLVHAQKKLACLLSTLRGHNRRLAQLVRQTKQHTSNSRSEIDTLHLSLQNLYYESRHLIGEIAACESFPHRHMQLPMPSEAEFLEKYPDWADQDEGEIMAARIEQEFQDRTQLEEQRKGLLAQKMDLMRENAKRKEELGKLDGDLERFIEAAKPIQQTFEKEW